MRYWKYYSKHHRFAGTDYMPFIMMFAGWLFTIPYLVHGGEHFPVMPLTFAIVGTLKVWDDYRQYRKSKSK